VATDIKTLLNKKGWTGDEVGRLMIADLVKSYSNQLSGKGEEGILTDSDKTRLVNALTEKADIQRYNDYRYIHEFLISLVTRYALTATVAESSYWKLTHFIGNVKEAEKAKEKNVRAPGIVTQSQYDEMKQADFDKKMEWAYSVESLVLYAISYFLQRYKEGKKTPFNKYFTAAKNEPITNPRIKANYWEYGNNGYYQYPDGTTSKDKTRDEKLETLKEKKGQQEAAQNNAFTTRDNATVAQVIETIKERKQLDATAPELGEWVDEPEAPEDATLFDVLEYLDGFYNSAETDDDNTFYELEQDFPELYKAIWEYLTKVKGLSFIGDIPKEDYVTNDDSIPMKTLYDNDVLDFRATVDTFDPTLDMYGYGGGIAVLQPSGTSYPKYRIDEQGHYKEPGPDPLYSIFGAEAFLDNMKESVAEWIETLKDQYRQLYAIHALVAIISEFIEVDDLNSLLQPIDEGGIDTLNSLFDLTIYSVEVMEEGDRPIEETRAEMRELLQPIRISALQPTAETIQAARKSIKFETFRGYAIDFLEDLMRGGDEQ